MKNYKKSVLLEALDLTEKIFLNIDHEKYKYKGYEIAWSIYNLVHI